MKGANGVDIGMMELFLLLHANDIVRFAGSPPELQQLLDILQNYCTMYRFIVNIVKTKIMIFRRGGGVEYLMI